MRELSVFVDESGDMHKVSDYYLITLLLHDQSSGFEEYERGYLSRLEIGRMSDIPMHLSPLLNGHDEFAGMTLAGRRKRLVQFNAFASKFPFRYLTLCYRKSEFSHDANLLTTRMKRDLVNALFDCLGYLQQFDSIKVYYDNGQPEVTDVLHAALEYALGKHVVVYKDASPKRYRLSQLTDYVCGLELIGLKFDRKEQRATDILFFETRKKFIKNYLKGLRRKMLP